VLEAGQLVEEGRHDTLLKANRLYAQLYSAQKQGYDKKV